MLIAQSLSRPPDLKTVHGSIQNALSLVIDRIAPNAPPNTEEGPGCCSIGPASSVRIRPYGSAVMICERWQRGVFWPALACRSELAHLRSRIAHRHRPHLKTSIMCLEGSSSRVGTNVKIRQCRLFNRTNARIVNGTLIVGQKVIL
jgi:hypothetical protein